VVENNLLKNDAAVAINIFLHALNTVTCLIDICISGRPWKVFHFIYPIGFGLWYAAFSLIYWGAGGVGICFLTPEGHPSATVHTNDGKWCDPYIYPILVSIFDNMLKYFFFKSNGFLTFILVF
jgi:hypothetical protein